jgi:hypothetical protein
MTKPREAKPTVQFIDSYGELVRIQVKGLTEEKKGVD